VLDAQRERTTESTLTEDEALRWFAEIAEAIEKLVTVEGWKARLHPRPTSKKPEHIRLFARPCEEDGVLCPITALALARMGTFFKEGDYAVAARLIGIPDEVAMAVARAVDSKSDEPLRKLLLEACGLKEA